MRAIVVAVYCVGVALAADAADLAERPDAVHRTIDASPKLAQRSKPRGLRNKINKFPEAASRELQDVLRYVPIKVDISMETSQSGDVDAEELGGFVGGHIITYLEQTLVDYEPVSVETEVTVLSELFRRLDVNETMPYILQTRVTGYVYFVGDFLPTSKYLNDVIEDAFVGDQEQAFMELIESADDPVLRSATRVWSGMGSSQEAYLPVVDGYSTSAQGNNVNWRLIAIGAGAVSGVVLIALFAGLRYRRSVEEKEDTAEDASLAEIPWLSTLAAKVAPSRRTCFDLQSTMEPPVEAVAGDTTSVMIAVGSNKPEKVKLRDDISAIDNVSNLQMAPDDKAQMLIKLYEESLVNDEKLKPKKSVSFEIDMFEAVASNSAGDSTSQLTSLESNQGEEVQMNQMSLDAKQSSVSSASSKFSLCKKVSFPTWTIKKKSVEQEEVLQVIEEEEDVSSNGDDVTLDNVNPDAFPVEYTMASEEPEMRGIFAAISKTESGIKEAWENISKKYSMDPNWDTNTSASSRDFEDTSFQCGLGPCVSSMTDSHAGAVDDDDDDEEESADSEMYSQHTSSEHMSQFTASENNSQFTNPSTNASMYSENSYESEWSEDEYSR